MPLKYFSYFVITSYERFHQLSLVHLHLSGQKLESKLTSLHNKKLADKIEEHKEAVKALQLESEESRRAELDVRLMEHKRSLGKFWPSDLYLPAAVVMFLAVGCL